MKASKTVEPVEIESQVLDELRANLESKRQQMLSLYEHDVRVGQETSDESADDIVDRANNSYNRELMFSLSNNEREMLLLIEEAAGRMERGDYGACVHCSGAISIPRLKALPWARYCIQCQESEERGVLEG